MAGTEKKEFLENEVMAEVLQLARDHKYELASHRKDFEQHRAEAKVAMAKIDTIHHQSTAMEEHAKNLNALPAIYEVLKGIKEDLIEPATGKKQMPVSVALLVIVILGGLLIFDRVRDSNKDFHLSPKDGVHITSQHQQEKKTE